MNGRATKDLAVRPALLVHLLALVYLAGTWLSHGHTTQAGPAKSTLPLARAGTRGSPASLFRPQVYIVG